MSQVKLFSRTFVLLQVTQSMHFKQTSLHLQFPCSLAGIMMKTNNASSQLSSMVTLLLISLLTAKTLTQRHKNSQQIYHTPQNIYHSEVAQFVSLSLSVSNKKWKVFFCDGEGLKSCFVNCFQFLFLSERSRLKWWQFFFTALEGRIRSNTHLALFS